jgi:type I restriction enzyme R subunit
MTSERATRKERIDPRLQETGWKVVPFKGSNPGTYEQSAVEEYETGNGPVDYALCDDKSVLGVVEAKRLSLGPQGVLVQAERYAKGIAQEPRYQGVFGVPFLYSTNGEEIWPEELRDG